MNVPHQTTQSSGHPPAEPKARTVVGPNNIRRHEPMATRRNGSIRRLSCGLVLALVFGVQAAAPEVGPRFDAANRLYEQGRFSEAAAAYEQLLQEGRASVALYFNLGNAEFKAGRLGRAIWAYRQARNLAPRDPDVRANLKFAREQVTGPTLPVGWRERLLGALSLNEWSGLAAASLWLWFGLLTARALRPGWRTGLRLPTWAAAAAALLLCGTLGLALRLGLSEPTAVVIGGQVPVRNGPFDESPVAFTVHDGAELRVLDRKDDWLQVTPGRGQVGWLARDNVQVLPVR
mgnify:CR=1 FL=1